MRVDEISIGDNPPDEINVIVEVPVGGQPIKYELDKKSRTMFVDRFLYTPMVEYQVDPSLRKHQNPVNGEANHENNEGEST